MKYLIKNFFYDCYMYDLLDKEDRKSKNSC